MKILTTLLFAGMLLVGTYPAMAQHRHARPDSTKQGGMMQGGMMQGGMMQGGMMQGGMMGGGMMQGGMMGGGMMQGMMHMHMNMMQQMMSNPLKRSSLTIYVLPTMKDLLDLSDEQVSSMKDAARAYESRVAELKEMAAKTGEQLKSALTAENPDPDRVKSLLRENATLHADLKALGFETARKMEALLTPEQRQKLAELTPMQMHHHMMANMTMMEMMKAMGGMMDGGMMGGGMMGGGMMRGGMMDGGMMQNGMKGKHKGGMNRQ
ncbi:Spy/CpxP family protein refolding chaperone [Rhodocaloribacter sp.]